MKIPNLSSNIQEEIYKFITNRQLIFNEPVRDAIFEKLEELDENCIILYFPQENEENDGSLIKRYINGRIINFVHINTYKVIEKQVFTAAHELAHILNLHEYLLTNCNGYNIELEESAMNYFAALVLMPHNLFKKDVENLFAAYGTDIKIDDFIKISLNLMDKYFVPFKAVVVRLYEIGIINEETANFLINNDNIIAKINDYIQIYGFTRLGIRSQKKGIKNFPAIISKVEEKEIFNENKIKNIRKKLNIPESNKLESIQSNIPLEKING